MFILTSNVFLVSFLSLLFWNPSERPLHGAEFSSLPSGLHLVNNDTFYFSYDFPSSNRSEANEEVGAGTGDGEGGLAVVVFRNRAMKEQEIERGDGRGKAKGRGRVMMSLGVVLSESSFDLLQPSFKFFGFERFRSDILRARVCMDSPILFSSTCNPSSLHPSSLCSP